MANIDTPYQRYNATLQPLFFSYSADTLSRKPWYDAESQTGLRGGINPGKHSLTTAEQVIFNMF